METLDFSLRQLQYAVAVADTGGFRRAADLCHVSQPSLSAQLAQLEKALGAQLFERDRRRVLLTAAGVDLVARARVVLTAACDLGSAAKRLSDPLAGTLRIGVIPTISPYLLPEISPAIRKRFPRLTIEWNEEKTRTILRDLADGRLDAVLLAQVPGMEEFDRELIGEDAFVLAGAASHPLLRTKRPAQPADLHGEEIFLLEDGHCFREQALSLCTRNRATEAGFRATSLSTLARMAGSGAGVTLLPAISLAVENRRGELATRPFAKPVPARKLVLAWRRQSPLSGALRDLAVVVRAEAEASLRL